MVKTLIVGATGLLGNQMIMACKKQGNDVHALVRPATRHNPEKMELLEAVGATIHEGDIGDYDSLLKACKAVDNVISAVNWQSGDERILVQAVKDANVKRFIPSAFGVDFALAASGSCLIYDHFSSVYKSVQTARIPYTLIHTNGFFTYWVSTLGDMTRLGNGLPPSEVNVYGDGNIKGAYVSESDVAMVTVRALNDSMMQNKAIQITPNTLTQNDIINIWEKMSGRSVKKVQVTLVDIEKMIEDSTVRDDRVMLSVAQLKRSYWIRGESVKRSPLTVEATELYPDMKFQTVQEWLARYL